jgi:hypothetical protein
LRALIRGQHAQRVVVAAAAAVVDVQSSRRSDLLPALCAPALLLPLARLLPGFTRSQPCPPPALPTRRARVRPSTRAAQRPAAFRAGKLEPGSQGTREGRRDQSQAPGWRKRPRVTAAGPAWTPRDFADASNLATVAMGPAAGPWPGAARGLTILAERR